MKMIYILITNHQLLGKIEVGSEADMSYLRKPDWKKWVLFWIMMPLVASYTAIFISAFASHFQFEQH